MAMLYTAYFDASGKSSDQGKAKSLCVAGFVSTAQKWERIDVGWKALLAKHDIDAPFHMTDFMARTDNQARNAFRHDAIDLLNKYTVKPFVISVMLRALERMHNEYIAPEDEAREPYVWCGIRACSFLYEWWGKHIAQPGRGADQLEVFFEAGDMDHGKLADAAIARYKRPIIFRPNKGKAFVPFQAADLLAWEFHSWAARHSNGNFFRRRSEEVVYPASQRRLQELALEHMRPDPVQREIVRLMPTHALRHMDWDALRAYCERYGYPRRDTS
jgi:hypothetical protein